MQIPPQQQIRLISSPTRLFSAANDFEGGNPKLQLPGEHANPSVGSWGDSCARSHVAFFPVAVFFGFFFFLASSPAFYFSLSLPIEAARVYPTSTLAERRQIAEKVTWREFGGS